MSKISFTKLGAKINKEKTIIMFNDQEIEVKQYLPLKEKMDLVNIIIDKAVDNNPNYYNPAEVETAEVIGIVLNYTNITFTEKQLSDELALYDALFSSGLAKAIINVLSDEEINCLEALIHDSLNSYYKHINSINGVLQEMGQSQESIQQLQELLQSSDLSFLKEIAGQLG